MLGIVPSFGSKGNVESDELYLVNQCAPIGTQVLLGDMSAVKKNHHRTRCEQKEHTVLSGL